MGGGEEVIGRGVAGHLNGAPLALGPGAQQPGQLIAGCGFIVAHGETHGRSVLFGKGPP